MGVFLVRRELQVQGYFLGLSPPEPEHYPTRNQHGNSRQGLLYTSVLADGVPPGWAESVSHLGRVVKHPSPTWRFSGSCKVGL